MGKDESIRIGCGLGGALMLPRFSIWQVLLIRHLWLFCWCLVPPSPLLAREPAEAVSQETAQSTTAEGELFWGEVYLEAATSPGENDNPVYDLFVKQGIHAFKILDKDLDIYIKGRLYYDRLEYYWNNRFEFGVGSRYRPFSELGLILFMEGLYGDYTDRETEDEPNPDDSPYLDLQGGLAFWQWWGKEPWQVEGLEFYLPSTGWRELYGDAIYYHHADNDFIATIDYKEGLMLGRFGPLRFDAYLALEGSWDTRTYEWYNYVVIGPGFRISPFPQLDLKISAEYFWGRFYRGAFGDVEANISDWEFTLAFWHGW